MPVMVKRADAVERAKEAINLMGTGVPIAEACRRAGTTLGTVRKVARGLGVRTKMKRTRGGRRRVVVDAHKIDKAQCVVRLMQYEGKSATEACKECHTTIRTVRAVRLDNCRTLRRAHGTYRLQVYEVKKFAVVFFGRLRNKGSAVAMTHTSPLADPSSVDRAGMRRDDYASIMWQYDFDAFHSTLSAADLCDYYMGRVLSYLNEMLVDTSVSKTLTSWLARTGTRGVEVLVGKGMMTEKEAEDIIEGRKAYDISPLEELFRVGVELDAESKCGVDDRKVTASFVCKATLARADAVDGGAFQVLVIRRSGKSAYPVTPKRIPYPHSLVRERGWKER